MASKEQRKFDLLAILFLGIGIWTFLVVVSALLFFWGTAYGANLTERGVVTVKPGPATLSGSPEIDVTVTYLGDDNANNSILIEWGLDGVDFSLGNNTSGTHPALPYNYAITGLSNNQIYQVRVTLQDGDGQPAAVVKTGIRPYQEHLHNALSTGSGTSKWASGWGTADGGSQYGEFTCKTCHDPSSNNIKRVRSNWTDGSLPAVPAKVNTVTTVFQSNANGTAEFAQDDSTSHSSSNRICESCHTATSYHRYDSSGLSADHNSSKDCLECHNHRAGFGPPACSLCHGGNSMTGATENNFWPDSGVRNVDNPGSENDEGEHVIHMTHLALRDGMTLQNLLDDANSKILQIAYCERCHGADAGSAAWHYQGDDVAEVSSFQDMDGTADDMAPAGSESSGTCSNIDCHNNKNTASPGWYEGVDNAPCTMCHTADGTNPNTVKVDPSSGLHYSLSSDDLVADSNGALLHDDAFTGGGNCLSCHTINPTNNHVDGTVQAPDQTTFNFLIDASIDIKLNNLADTTDDTCAASCHTDSKNWYRFWSTDAFDATPFDTSSAGAITTTISNDLPPSCNVCHGEFINGWAEGTAHYNMDLDNVSSGASHNSQNPNENPGAACVDCHLYPDHITPNAGALRHENGQITLTDDQSAPDDFTPIEDTTGARQGVYCQDCHENAANDGFDSNTFEFSAAFPGWASVQIVETDRNPEYTCFSGANGCHGDQTNNWWPNMDSTDPANYPNREGAHYEHGTTIGELLAAQMEASFPGSRPDTNGDGRPDATQEDRNKTCNFCHPMAWNASRGVWESLYHRANTPETGTVVTDVFGGYNFNGADKRGVYSSGNPSNYPAEWTDIDTDGSTGFAYQLEEDPLNPGQGTYPLDHDGEYWQYIDAYKGDNTVRNGTCANIHCHSNSPFTPSWYGDHQAPGQITDLAASTHNQDATNFPTLVLHSDHNTYEWDEPGSARLYWTAPGNNGDFSGVADQYEVFYRPAANGAITADNLPQRWLPDGTFIAAGASDDGNTKMAGNAATVLRQGNVQEMMVEGLSPGVSYNFAIVTRDAPHYKDIVNAGDGIYETLVSQANYSVVSNNATATAHTDDVIPIFYGVDKLHPHDVEKVVNLSWDSAKDHTMPITYRVWYTNYSMKTHLANNGPLYDEVTDPNGSNAVECFTEGSPPTAVGDSGGDYCIETESTEAIHYQIVVPTAGDLYSFLVRAKDGSGNYDDNTNVQMVLPKAAPLEATDTKMYVYNGTNMVEQADIANPVFPGAGQLIVAGSDVILQTNTTVSRDSVVSGISFDAQIVWGSRSVMQMSAEFGYWDAGFVRLGTMNDTEVQNSSIYLTRKVTRLAKFSFANYRGLVPANKTLAIRFRRYDANTGTDLDINYGTVDTKGQLLANIQPYNHQPNGSFAIALNSPEVRSGGYIDVGWVSANPQDAGQTVHYDVFGSADNGATYPYVIATDVLDTDDLNGAEYGRVTWDTVGDGLTSTYNCKVKVEVGDGYQYEDPSAPNYPDPFETLGATIWSTHNVFESTTIAVDNITDVEPPAAVTIHTAETRPKQGSVYLTWTAVGDDGLNHGTRVSYYDIRYRPDPLGTGVLNEGNWDAAVQVNGEPVPGFSGSLESFDLLGLAPELEYDIGIKACDEADNCSTLGSYSTTEGWRTGEGHAEPVHGGPFYCGICHSTPPDEPDTKGIHREHGYTLEDCAKCHGDGNGITNDVTQYDGRHYNGYIDIGWAKNSDGTHAPLVQIPIENGGATDVVITQTTDNNGPVTIYQDLSDGPGGYNMPAGQSPDLVNHNYTDSGTCSNFGSANANGCHGPFNPQWAPSNAVQNPPIPACSDCHGDSSVARDLDPYGRIWDCNDAGAPSELVKASPPIDNHGQSATTSKYTGAHEVHLNSSFRFAKGDSCRLCHLDTMYSGEHADGKVDIRFDAGANQSASLVATGQFNGPEATTGMSCGSLSTDSCHDTFESDGVTPKALVDWPVWNVPGAQCDSCHGMSTMGTIPHVSDNGAQACDWCHVPGHPQSPDGVTPGDPDALLVNNNPAVGINYKSGGIHIRKVINGRTHLNSGELIDTLAEMCWGCHEDNGISEWGGDDLPTNTTVEPYNGVGSIYDYGNLPSANQTSWYADATEGSEVGATWSSAEANFAYKTGRIQSTHSTDPTGVSTVTWDSANGRYNEELDPVAKIRCTNCHDVHDLNKADNDTATGAPYLRGTWKSNPYEEDGAPWAKTYATPAAPTPSFGPVPRGGTTYAEKGGYYIDQNNVRPGTSTSAQYPTSGWTVTSSAGLCVLCHDADVDNMDKLESENLWLGTNGHSNSALGGTFTNGANIFDYTHGRPVPYNNIGTLGSIDYTVVPDMAIQSHLADMLSNSESYAYVHRSAKEGWLDPNIGANYAYNSYNWGVSIDASTTDVMYHQFSCSKCHNPHASRLPKLMITNCLDLRHNTWDDQAANSLQNTFTSSTLDRVDRNMGTGYYATAQNCHRFDAARGDENNDNIYEDRTKRGGWNKVTPWVKDNLTNAEHKGSRDPAYGTSNSTSPWRHSDFPTETSGW